MKKSKIEFYVFLILIAIVSIAIAPKTFQNDTFFTIAGGQKVLEDGINEIDTLTWHENLKFTNDRWIFDVIIATIYNYFGFFGIYVFVMIFSLLIGGSFYYFLIKRNINIVLSFIATICIMYYGNGILAARSQIISILLFIIEVYCIEKLLETNKVRYWISLIIIPLIIANVHASIFPVYFIFYLPYIVEAILYRLPFVKNDGEKLVITKRKYIKSMIIVIIFGILSGCCTPIGEAPFTSMFKAAGGISASIISELQPIVPINNYPFVLINIIFIGILGFTKVKMNIADFFLFVGLDILALSANRTIFYFLFVGGVSLIRLIDSFFIEYDIYKIPLNTKIEKLIYVLVSLSLLITSANFITQKSYQNYVDISGYPVDACNYILNNLDTENMKIYNGFNYGSYLEFVGIKSFIDSRSGMFSEEFNEGVTILEDYSKVSSGKISYKKIFDKYEITHALLVAGEIISIYIQEDEEWKLLYQDDSFVLYEKL